MDALWEPSLRDYEARTRGMQAVAFSAPRAAFPVDERLAVVAQAWLGNAASELQRPDAAVDTRRHLERKYRRETADGRVAGYTLFTHKRALGGHFLFVPPGAVVLFERMPNWQGRVRPYEGVLT